jgi:4-hydroxy-2-oxoheptanedioate aldolase
LSALSDRTVSPGVNQGEDEMRPNRLRQIWKDGGAAVNGWLQIPHGFAAEIMAAQGWDSLTVDLQHGPVGYDVALTMLQAFSSSDVTPLARVPWNEPGIIMKMLDAGCYGIICPMINTPEEAKRFVGACRYPPAGYRSFGPTRVSFYAGADYAPNANETVIALAMIETMQAIQNLDAILDTPGLDGVYVGPADLSQSLTGKPGVDHKEPRMVELLDQILEGCNKRGLIAGINVASTDYACHIIEKGYRFVTIQADGRLLATAANEAIKAVKGTAGGPTGSARGPY